MTMLTQQPRKMTPQQSASLILEWRAIVADRDGLDFRIARWASRARQQFPSDPAGTSEFLRWLDRDVGLSMSERTQCLRLARSFDVTQDEQLWRRQGSSQIAKLVDLTPTQRATVLTQAANGKQISRVVGEVVKVSSPRVPKPESLRDRDVAMVARYARQLSDDDLTAIVVGILATDAPPAVRSAAQRLAAGQRRKSKAA